MKMKLVGEERKRIPLNKKSAWLRHWTGIFGSLSESAHVPKIVYRRPKVIFRTE